MNRIYSTAAKFSSALFVLFVFSSCTQDHTWPQFRGINGSGIASEQQDTPLVLDKDRNLLWSTGLSFGHSSPCIWNKHIFITGFEEEGKLLRFYCLDRSSGEIRWQKDVSVEEFGNLHTQNNPASATPATDGERVVFYSGCYGLICYDLKGNLLWELPMSIPESRYGMGTSPVISGDLVILNCFGFENDPHLMALNKYDGTIRWKYSPTTPEEGFSFGDYAIPPDSYSTPVVYKDRVIIYRSEDISAYDINSGEQVWKFSTGIPDAVASPVVGNDILYAAVFASAGNNSAREQFPDFPTLLELYDLNQDSLIDAGEVRDFAVYNDPDKGIEFGGGTLDQFLVYLDSGNDGYIDGSEWKVYRDMCEAFYQRHGLKAIMLGGEGEISTDHFLWGNNDYVSSIACPLYYNDLVYMVRSGGMFSCFDAADGTLLYREKLGAAGAYLASPVIVSGRIYCVSFNGVITVLQAGSTFTILETSDMGERISATPAIVDSKVYLRTAEALYAFGN